VEFGRGQPTLQQDFPLTNNSTLMKSSGALCVDLICRWSLLCVILVFFEICVKLIIGMVTGLGLGLVTFGLAIMQRGILLDFETFARNGPPPAEAILAGGVALLTTGLTLLILFLSPFSRRRWFIADQEQAVTSTPDSNS